MLNDWCVSGKVGAAAVNKQKENWIENENENENENESSDHKVCTENKKNAHSFWGNRYYRQWVWY